MATRLSHEQIIRQQVILLGQGYHAILLEHYNMKLTYAYEQHESQRESLEWMKPELARRQTAYDVALDLYERCWPKHETLPYPYLTSADTEPMQAYFRRLYGECGIKV
jgi:hypothetical protein